MELPDGLKPDLHRALLGPLSLANEIFGAFLPGCIFSALLLLKGRLVTTLLIYPYLGYKTKIACVLLASYVFGKVSLSVVTLLGESVKLTPKTKAKPEADAATREGGQTALQALTGFLEGTSKPVKLFINGLLAGRFMLGKSGVYEYYAAHTADTLFHLSAGLVFLLAASVPGDGRFRYVELAIGLILLARGLSFQRSRPAFFAGLMGMMVGNSLADLQPDQLAKTLNVAAAVLSRLGQPLAASMPTAPSGGPNDASSPSEAKREGAA